MTVVASTLVPVEDTPTDPTDVWEPTALLQPNWEQGIRVTTRFASSVFQSDGGAETRVGLADKPTLEVMFNASGLSQGASWLSNIAIQRMSQAFSLLPLWTDVAMLTSSAAPGTTIPIPTDYRRLFVGAWVAVYHRGGGNLPIEDFHLAKVTAVNPADIEIDTATTETFNEGDIVVPLIEARLSFDQQQAWATGTISQVPTEGQEQVSSASLDAVAASEGWPASAQLYDGIPIFDFLHNQDAQIRYEMDLPGSYTRIGRGAVLSRTSVGRPLLTATIQRAFCDRQSYWDFLQFFHAARGRTNSFWFLGNSQEYELLSIGAGNISVTAVGPEQNWDYVPYIGIREEDGTLQIREVTSVIRIGETDIVNLDSSFDPLTSPALAVTSARRARFDADALEEMWQTDDDIRVQFSITEVVEEKDITLNDFQNLANGQPASFSANPRDLFVQCDGSIAFEYLLEVNALKDGRVANNIPNIPVFGALSGQLFQPTTTVDPDKYADIRNVGGLLGDGTPYYYMAKLSPDQVEYSTPVNNFNIETICFSYVGASNAGRALFFGHVPSQTNYPNFSTWRRTTFTLDVRSPVNLVVNKGDGTGDGDFNNDRSNPMDIGLHILFYQINPDRTVWYAEVLGSAPNYYVNADTGNTIAAGQMPVPGYEDGLIRLGPWTGDFTLPDAAQSFYQAGIVNGLFSSLANMAIACKDLAAQFGIDAEIL